MAQESDSLEYTPTWVVALVCSVIVVISLVAVRSLHYLGKCLRNNNQEALFEALQKLKEELMLLGFISLLLTVFQSLISNICILEHLSYHMLPCKRPHGSASEHTHYHEYSHEFQWNRRRLFSHASESKQCKPGNIPLLSVEALHHLHIFIFVLAVVHVVFCASTTVLGGAKISKWKHWENSIKQENLKRERALSPGTAMHAHHHHAFVMERAMGFWRKTAVVSWLMSFFKQFFASVTKSDYAALRLGFIMNHCNANPNFDFHKYMMRVLGTDFRKVVGISWYLWLFVIIFLLLDVDGWHTYFWLSFLPLILLLAVGAKLEHIITQMTHKVAEGKKDDFQASTVKPSDKHFWFNRPGVVLYLIHFILFQNSFEIAFFFWILCTYGFNSCIMEKAGYIVSRLVIGVLIQVLCSYSTLPLYALVTQMGTMFKGEIFNDHTHATLQGWAEGTRKRKKPDGGSSFWKFGRKSEKSNPFSSSSIQMQSMAVQAFGRAHDIPEQSIVLEGITTSVIEHSTSRQIPHLPS